MSVAADVESAMIANEDLRTTVMCVGNSVSGLKGTTCEILQFLSYSLNTLFKRSCFIFQGLKSSFLFLEINVDVV